MPENINDPLAHFVAYLDSERKRQRDNEDAILDQKISFLHDMISTPGANPARTAQALEDMMNLQAGKGGNAPRKKGMAGFMGESVSPQSTILSGLIHGSIPYQGNTTETIQKPGFENQADVPLNQSQIPGFTHPGMVQKGNIGLEGRPRLKNADGSISTVRSMGVGEDNGVEAVIPTIGPEGEDYNAQQAIAQYRKTGQNLGKFASVPEANAYASNLHDSYAAGKFDGKSILENPVMIPPEPLQAPPEAKGMLNAARSMQRTQPVANQPMVRSPEEMAQLEGNAEGIKYKSREKGQRDADTEAMQELGASDVEIKDALLRKMGGAGANSSMQDADAGFWTVGDKTVHALRIFDPRTGATKTIDALTRLPLPPDAQPTAAPSTSNETDPVSYKEYERYVTDEKTRGNATPLSYDKWLTMDANRKRSVTTNITRNDKGFTGPQQFAAATKLQTQWNKESKAYTTMINQFNLMQEGLKQAQAGNMNSGSQAILVTFQKILDPNSVVRESEYARSPEGLGLMNRMSGAITRLSQGGAGVPVSELAGFVQTGKAFINGLKNSLGVARTQIDKASALAGIDPSLIYGEGTGVPDINGATPAGVDTPLDQKIMDYFSKP